MTVVVVGKESVGKSQLIAGITGASAYIANFGGATLSCDTYNGAGRRWADTPGIWRQSDSETTRLALGQLAKEDEVLVVAQATHLDEDLAELLPFVQGKKGAVAVTFWDKVAPATTSNDALQRLSRAVGVSFVPVDARHVSEYDRSILLAALDEQRVFQNARPREQVGWRIEPRPTWLEHSRVGRVVALLLLFLPAVVAVWRANSVAEVVQPLVEAGVTPMVALSVTWHPLPAALVTGDYGVLTMGPLLLVWAVPTVVLYALLLGAYKASGLLERLSIAIHPLMLPFGLGGRDVVRVLMGFGCNVPAVISTRACSGCSRGTCISAIAFGAACSYQLGATLGVFSAMGQGWLVAPYLGYLTVTTLVYTRLTAPAAARSAQNPIVVRRPFLILPSWKAVWREARGTLTQFFRQAIPIFLLISAIAALLAYSGILGQLAGVIAPVMALFHLPAQAGLPLVMAMIRKDGILLFAEQGLIQSLTPLQALTGVYLAGVLLPCLVTALTIAREQSPRFALTLLAKQATAAVAFTLVLAWVPLLFV